MKSDFDRSDFASIPDPFGDGRGVSEGPPGPLRERLAASSPTRSRVRARRVIALGAALAYDVLALVVLKTRPDLGSVPTWVIALGLLVPLGAAVMALSAVSRGGALGLGQPVARVAMLAAGAPFLFALITLLDAPLSPDDDAFWPHALACMATSVALSVPPLILGLWALRNAFVAASAWRTAALGVACGALAAATLSLVCPIGHGLHVLVGHGAMTIGMGLAGALLGRRITSA